MVYEKRRVYIQYVVFYKSDRPVPKLPPVPKISTSSRRSGFASDRLRTPSPGGDDDRRRSSDDERMSDSDDDDDDDTSRRRSRRRSAESPSRWSSSENLSPEHRDSMNDYFSSATGTRNGGVQKVSVTRERTRALLQARGQSLMFIIDMSYTHTHYLLPKYK